jgi:hypothetical protein
VAERTPGQRERHRLAQAKWRAANPERAAELRRASVRRWRAGNPEEARRQTRESTARLRERRRAERGTPTGKDERRG